MHSHTLAHLHTHTVHTHTWYIHTHTHTRTRAHTHTEMTPHYEQQQEQLSVMGLCWDDAVGYVVDFKAAMPELVTSINAIHMPITSYLHEHISQVIQKLQREGARRDAQRNSQSHPVTCRRTICVRSDYIVECTASSFHVQDHFKLNVLDHVPS
jgi:hypothetical protein